MQAGRIGILSGRAVVAVLPTELDTKKIAIDPTAKDRVVMLRANMRTARSCVWELLD
jgi:hypothetical protein